MNADGMVRKRILSLAVVAICASACGSSGTAAPTGPSTGAISGTWSGTITDDALGPGIALLVMAESQGQVTGTWTTRRAGVSDLHGTVSGGLLTSIYVLGLTRDTPLQCPATAALKGTGAITFNGTLSGTDRLSGSYSSELCDDAQTGTIDLTRQ